MVWGRVVVMHHVDAVGDTRFPNTRANLQQDRSKALLNPNRFRWFLEKLDFSPKPNKVSQFWHSKRSVLTDWHCTLHSQIIAADLVTGLPKAQGYNALFAMCCCHTKQAHIIPTHSTVMAQGLATLFRDNIWKLHGLPEMALSDQGPQFTAEFMCELNNILGIQTKLSTAYHPQTNGQTKRLNQDVEQYLRLFISQRQNSWPEWITCAEFVYSNKVHSMTKVSPFYANYRRHPRMEIELRRAGKSELAKEFAECMKEIYKEASTALSKAHDDMTHYADQHRGSAPEYKIGDKVWLSMKGIKINQPSRKLAEQQLRPFKIVKVVSPNMVKLKLPTSFKIHNVINVL